MSPIPFPAGVARDIARVRHLATDLMLLVKDLDREIGVTATAYARIDCLAHDASMKGFDLIAALGALTETNSTRWSAQQDQSYAVDDADQLVAALSNLTDGGAA